MITSWGIRAAPQIWAEGVFHRRQMGADTRGGNGHWTEHDLAGRVRFAYTCCCGDGFSYTAYLQARLHVRRNMYSYVVTNSRCVKVHDVIRKGRAANNGTNGPRLVGASCVHPLPGLEWAGARERPEAPIGVRFDGSIQLWW